MKLWKEKSTSPNVNVKVCSKIFLPPRPSESGTYCSYGCRGRDNRFSRVDRSGYWYKIVDDHPFKTKDEYVSIQRLIMEKKLGRYIKPGEVIHHKNENKKDNRIINLQVMSDSKHKSLHAKKRGSGYGQFKQAL